MSKQKKILLDILLVFTKFEELNLFDACCRDIQKTVAAREFLLRESNIRTSLFNINVSEYLTVLVE